KQTRHRIPSTSEPYRGIPFAAPLPRAGSGAGSLLARVRLCWETLRRSAGPTGRLVRSCIGKPKGLGRLILLTSLLFAQPLPRKRFLSPALFSGLPIEAVFFDLLSDIFLLHLALKPAQGVFQ